MLCFANIGNAGLKLITSATNKDLVQVQLIHAEFEKRLNMTVRQGTSKYALFGDDFYCRTDQSYYSGRLG